MDETITFDADVLDDPILRAADNQAVQHFVETGEPVDPLVRARVHARANRIREEVFRRFGYIDTEALRPPTVDDE